MVNRSDGEIVRLWDAEQGVIKTAKEFDKLMHSEVVDQGQWKEMVKKLCAAVKELEQAENGFSH